MKIELNNIKHFNFNVAMRWVFVKQGLISFSDARRKVKKAAFEICLEDYKLHIIRFEIT